MANCCSWAAAAVACSCGMQLRPAARSNSKCSRTQPIKLTSLLIPSHFIQRFALQSPSVSSLPFISIQEARSEQELLLLLSKGRGNQSHSKMESTVEKMSSSVQSWVEDHKLATIGGVWASAVGASVAYSRRRAPGRSTSLRLIHARMHAQALTLAVLGGAALAHHYYQGQSGGGGKNKKSGRDADLDYDFYSQLPAATDADGNENERWSW